MAEPLWQIMAEKKEIYSKIDHVHKRTIAPR